MEIPFIGNLGIQINLTAQVNRNDRQTVDDYGGGRQRVLGQAMDREPEYPTWHFRALSPSKEHVPFVLPCIGRVLLCELREGVCEDDLVVVQEFVAIPLNLGLR